MSILKRFTDIMSANINSLLDKCEDPAKMVDQILRNLNDDLGKVKAETASIMAEETRAKRELAECNQEINKLVEYAKRAVKSGNDDDARFFLSKKADLTKNQEALEQKVQLASANALKMRQMHDKLIKEINELNARRDSIKTKVATANMQKRLNDLGGSLHHSTANLGAFARMEEKANRMLDEVNAMAELNTPKDDLQSLMDKYDAQPSSSIEDELTALKGESSSSIDDELLALKSATYEE